MESKVTVGDRFGSLVVVSRAPSVFRWGAVRTFLECICDCGEKRVVQTSQLSERSACETCIKKRRVKISSAANRIHGMKGTRTYRIWIGMKNRCTNPRNYSFAYYGGRGISVCSKWMSFPGFFEDMGEAPESLTLDRINSNGDYCKENCRWATRAIQSENSSQSKFIEFDGKRLNMRSWERILGWSRGYIARAMKRGTPIHEILVPKRR
jgi:hypothetical protein